MIRIMNPKFYQLLEDDVSNQYKCVAKIESQYLKYRNRKNNIVGVKKINKYENIVGSLTNIFKNRDILSLL